MPSSSAFHTDSVAVSNVAETAATKSVVKSETDNDVANLSDEAEILRFFQVLPPERESSQNINLLDRIINAILNNQPRSRFLTFLSVYLQPVLYEPEKNCTRVRLEASQLWALHEDN